MLGKENEVRAPEGKSRAAFGPWLVAVVWMAVVFAGLMIVWNYANTPAKATEPRDAWPTNPQIALNSERPTLVMFVHPQCPCTRASVAELARIAAQREGRFAGWVVLFTPDQADADWEHSDLVRSAEQIPGIRIVTDHDGTLARLFQITTSGHTLLYSPTGALQFSGGITKSRGHSGDNDGESAILSLLDGSPAGLSHTPVFGCPIHEDSKLP